MKTILTLVAMMFVTTAAQANDKELIAAVKKDPVAAAAFKMAREQIGRKAICQFTVISAVDENTGEFELGYNCSTPPADDGESNIMINVKGQTWGGGGADVQQVTISRAG